MIQKKPKRATTGKLGEMEIWWGRRAAKKGDYRQAKSDRNIKKQKRETAGKEGEMGYREAEKGDSRQKERWKNDGGGEQPRRDTTGKQERRDRETQ